MSGLSLSSLVSNDTIAPLFECFSKQFGPATALLDLNGNIIVETGWQPICKNFHRTNSTTAARCTQSDTALNDLALQTQQHQLYQCANGMVDVVFPILVADNHLGNAYIGQFLLQQPDTEVFRRQAISVGFDEVLYLDSLGRVPVMSDQEITSIINIFAQMMVVVMKLAHESYQHALTIQKLEHSLAVKQHFLANMSHELRTPMNGIQGMLGLLNDAKLASPYDDYAFNAYQSSQNLMHVLDDVIDVTRATEGQFELNPCHFSLGDLLAESVQLFEYAANAKAIDLQTKLINAESATRFVGDKLRIGQIVSALVSNAIKFTPRKGRVKVAFNLINFDPACPELRIAVSDTGIGITPQKQHDIFAPFEQGHSEIGGKLGGTGLGLTICKALVELMTGTIECTSELARGSCFSVSLPIQISHSHHISRKVQPLGLPELKVLAVDDYDINLRVLEAIFASREITIEAVSSAVEAIKMCQQSFYDVILMDVHMPELNGLEATKHIRSLPNIRQPLIIGLSASTLPEDVIAGIAAGMDDYIGKPFKIEDFVQVFQRLSKVSRMVG